MTALTGMSTIAVSICSAIYTTFLNSKFNLILQACFLIPMGVAIYVVVGGMRSTLLCD